MCWDGYVLVRFVSVSCVALGPRVLVGKCDGVGMFALCGVVVKFLGWGYAGTGCLGS